MPSFQMQGQHDTPWHARESEEVLAALESTADTGLSEEEARQRLEAYGKNEIPEPPPEKRFFSFCPPTARSLWSS